MKHLKQVKPMSQQTPTFGDIFGDIRCIVNPVPLAMHLSKKTAYKAQSAQMKERQDKLAYESVQTSLLNLVNQMMSFEIRQNFK